MASPQTGIFALGTASHAYLQQDATADGAAVVAAVASLREPRTTAAATTSSSTLRTPLHGLATVGEEISSWSYHHDVDLTDLNDGTENPTLVEALQVIVVPKPGAGGSALLLQKWQHDATTWESLGVERQEEVIGRTKADSLELDPRPADFRVASTDQDTFGTIPADEAGDRRLLLRTVDRVDREPRPRGTQRALE